MKVGDIVIKAGPSHNPATDKVFAQSNGMLRVCRSSGCLEVAEDHGETIMVRCVRSNERHVVQKDDFCVAKTLERRLEENDLQPVIGKMVEP